MSLLSRGYKSSDDSRSRKKSGSNFAPLTSVGIVGKDNSLVINNEDFSFINSSQSDFYQPKNVQDHITQYRQQKCKQLTSESTDETSTDFFQDMEPKIVRQQRVVLQTDKEPSRTSSNSRLSLTQDARTNELSAWEEIENTGGWDVDKETTDELLRETRRSERERKLVENIKKRMDKDQNRIASKIS